MSEPHDPMTDPARLDFLDRVAREHDRWEREVEGTVTFDPARAAAVSDYNLWYVSLEATAAQLDELARRITGTA